VDVICTLESGSSIQSTGTSWIRMPARSVSTSRLPSEPDAPAGSPAWVVCHMIEEYARHNGHADLLRERIDGATGL
jgi:hypothetical protein